jgi:hypothetical protein
MEETAILQLLWVSINNLIIIDHKLFIIGGWLGQGPLAADDMHILDL